MFAKLFVGLVAAAGVTLAGVSYSKSTQAGGSCCYPGAACCEAQSACCEKSAACCGLGDCCSPGAACCDTGECCGTDACCETAAPANGSCCAGK